MDVKVKELVLLVCGGRDYDNESEIEYHLNGLNINGSKIKRVIAGACRGADTMAVRWARGELIEVREFPANWKKHGKRAGYLRNVEMLDVGKPDLVVAFGGGKGTKMMCNLAESRGIKTIKVG